MTTGNLSAAAARGREGGSGGAVAALALDEAHLQRMSLGDRALEREVLQIFVRQTAVIMERLVDAEPALVTAAAHTLTGSARGIGAWRVAQAAEQLERASAAGNDPLEAAIAELKAASLEACAAIGARLANAR